MKSGLYFEILNIIKTNIIKLPIINIRDVTDAVNQFQTFFFLVPTTNKGNIDLNSHVMFIGIRFAAVRCR